MCIGLFIQGPRGKEKPELSLCPSLQTHIGSKHYRLRRINQKQGADEGRKVNGDDNEIY